MLRLERNIPSAEFVPAIQKSSSRITCFVLLVNLTGQIDLKCATKLNVWVAISEHRLARRQTIWLSVAQETHVGFIPATVGRSKQQ